MESYFVWANEVAAVNYDTATVENSPRFPMSIWKDRLKDRNHVVSIILGPIAGWPASRTRRYATSIRKESLIWTGPQTDEEIAKDFAGIFGATTELDASVFAGIDTNENYKKLVREVYSVRGVWFKPEQAFDIRAVLPPNTLTFYDEYDRMRRRDFAL